MPGLIGVSVLASNALIQTLKNFTDMGLAHWVTISNVSNSVVKDTNLTDVVFNRNYYLEAYVVFAAVNTVLTFARTFMFAYAGTRAPKWN